MKLLNSSTVNVKRYGEQTFDDFGNVSVPTVTEFTIKCNWQPLATSSKGEVVAILPSGVQISDTMLVFTKHELRVDSEATGIIGDEVMLDGILYKVLLERNWNRYLSIKHREYVVVRKTKK